MILRFDVESFRTEAASVLRHYFLETERPFSSISDLAIVHAIDFHSNDKFVYERRALQSGEMRVWGSIVSLFLTSAT